MPSQGSGAEWYAELAASVAVMGALGVAQLVIDPTTGTVVAASPAVEALIGGSAPRRLDELVERGLLARPDLLRQLRRAALERYDDDVPRGPLDESAHSWSDRVRLHRPDGTSIDVDLNVVLHVRPKFPAEAVLVTVAPAGEVAGASPQVAGVAGTWRTVYDRELRVVASDQTFNPFSTDPADMVGVLAAVLVHPEDLPEVLPLVMAVISDDVRTVSYTVRLVAADGGWILTHTDLHRLVGADGPVYVADQRTADERRQVIEAGTLSPREGQVVAALFDGLRVARLAERDGVSTNTVRTQLKSIYRKLAVSGQAELLARFHRPA